MRGRASWPLTATDLGQDPVIPNRAPGGQGPVAPNLGENTACVSQPWSRCRVSTCTQAHVTVALMSLLILVMAMSPVAQRPQYMQKELR